MSKFYTFIDKVGNEIYHRYSENGKAKKEVVREFPINLYLRKQGGEHRSLYGDSLGKKEFDTISEARKLIDRYKDVPDFDVFGNDDFTQQFIAHTYPEDIVFDLSQFVIVSADLEVEHDTGFPEPSEASHEILSISMKVFGGQSYCFGTKEDPKVTGVEYVRCLDEKELLILFAAKFRQIGPHILTGWNVYGFDVPYLVNRMENVLSPNASNKLSVFSDSTSKCVSDTHNQSGFNSYKILGCTVLDYMDLYKKFSPDKQESYSLNFISGAEEVGEKIDYSDYGNSLMRLYRENWPLFAEYNDVDNQLVEKLDNKLQFIQLAVAIAVLTKSRFSDSIGSVKIWDNLIYHMALKDGLQIPPVKRSSRVSNAGGYVRAAIPGVYRWPVTFDLTSLYPSIARMLNMSPETLISDPIGNVEMVDRVLSGEIVPEDYTEENVCFAINGARFRTDVDGIVAKAMGFVFYERKRYKGLMKAEKQKLEVLKRELSELEKSAIS